MEIRRVEVRNIRSYEAATLDLGPGTTLLVGDVGSGKTSLLYAIELALFGTAEVDATFLIRHGASDASVRVVFDDQGRSVEVERQFRRVHKRGREAFEPGRLTYRVDGAATQYSSTELRQRVIDHLGFRDNPSPRAHSDVWRWAVYVPQEQMREILAATPAERLATVRRALGVERYHLAAENAREVSREFRQTAAALRGQAATLRDYADDLAPAGAERSRLEAEERAGRSRLGALEAAATRARERAEASHRVLEAFAGDRRRLAEFVQTEEADRARSDAIAVRRARIAAEGAAGAAERSELETVATGRSAAEEQLARAESALAGARAENQRLSVAEASWAGAVSLRATREKELGRAEADIDRARSEIEALRSQLAAIDAEGDRSEPAPPEGGDRAGETERLVRARTAEANASAEAAVARHELDELRSLIAAGVCPRCHQSVRSETFDHHAQEAAAAVRAAEDRLQECRAAREGAESRRAAWEEHDRRRAAWTARADRRRAVERSLEQRTEALPELEGRLTEATSGLLAAEREAERLEVPPGAVVASKAALLAREAEHRQASAALERARRAAERRAALSDRGRLLEEEDARLAEEAAEVADRREARERTIAELRASLAREPARRVEADAAAAELDAAERSRLAEVEVVARLSERVEEAGRRRQRAEAAAAERERLTAVAESVESKSTWLVTRFHDAVLDMEKRVLEKAQAEFAETFRTYFAALMDDPDLVAVTDPAFTPAAEIRGVETPAEALSGGERTSLALAYRLALSRVVRSLGQLRLETLMLDEPTDGFSPEQVQSMGELLDRLALPQVILVSHERELEAIADRVVVVEKQNGASGLRDSSRPEAPP